MPALAVLWLLWLRLLSPTADAAVISRLGGLYLYDPLTFDSGVLQWGGTVRGGAGQGAAGSLEVAGEAPFYRELSVRVAHQQGFQSGPDGHRLTWRLRAPVIQSTRFGRLDTTQLYYIGGITLRGPMPFDPAHEAGGAWVTARDRLSQHLQAAATVRDREQAGEDGARAGLAVREALIVQPLRPVAGPRGQWTASLSVVEATWLHYGLVGRPTGQVDLSAAAPAIHRTIGRTTWSLGALPRLRLTYTPDAITTAWGGYATLRATHTNRME